MTPYEFHVQVFDAWCEEVSKRVNEKREKKDKTKKRGREIADAIISALKERDIMEDIKTMITNSKSINDLRWFNWAIPGKNFDSDLGWLLSLPEKYTSKELKDGKVAKRVNQWLSQQEHGPYPRMKCRYKTTKNYHGEIVITKFFIRYKLKRAPSP